METAFLSKKITLFIDYLRKEKNYSEHTIRAYQKDVESFIEFLNEEDITVVRPNGYYSAADIDLLVGRRLSRDIKKYENITPEHLK